MESRLSDAQVEALSREARKAKGFAYAPYSGFPVGAAVLGEDGKIYSGCNVENASYGLSNCGERTALFKMVSEGCRHFKAVLVCCGKTPQEAVPCGACRQVMSELCCSMEEAEVILEGEDGGRLFYSLQELYPHGFTSFRPEAAEKAAADLGHSEKMDSARKDGEWAKPKEPGTSGHDSENQAAHGKGKG